MVSDQIDALGWIVGMVILIFVVLLGILHWQTRSRPWR